MIIVKVGDRPEVMFPGGFLIGRAGRGADLEIDDEYVSPRHALITRDGSDWWVEDAGSTNGTWVNGIPARWTYHPVHKGTKLRVGRTEMILVPV